MKHIYPAMLLAAALAACNNDYDLENIDDDMGLKDMQLVAPLGTVNCSIKDALEYFDVEDIMTEDDTLSVVYTDTYTIPPVNVIAPQIPAGIPAVFPAGTGRTFKAQGLMPVMAITDGSRIDSLNTENSAIALNVQSNLPVSAQLKITFAGGPTFAQNVETDIAQGATQREFAVQNLSTWHVQEIPATGNLRVYAVPFEAELVCAGDVTMNSGDVTMQMGVSNFSPRILWGDFSGITAVIDDFTHIKIPTNIPEGSQLSFYNPKVTFNVRNSIGLKSVLAIDELYTTEKDTDEKRYADFNGNPTFFASINAPKTPYTTAESTLRFDKDNGGTDRFLTTEYLPNELHYSFRFASSGTGFIDLKQKPEIEATMKIPFIMNEGSFLVTSDTLNLDLQDIGDDVDIRQLTLKTEIENGFPVNIDVVLQMLDDNYQIVTSIREQRKSVKSAKTDADGRAAEPTKDVIYLTFEDGELADLGDVAYIRVSTVVKGADPDTRVHLRPSDYVKIKSNFYGKMDINF